MKGVGYELVSNGSMYEHLVGIEGDACRILLGPLVSDVSLSPCDGELYPVGVSWYTPTGYLGFVSDTQSCWRCDERGKAGKIQ